MGLNFRFLERRYKHKTKSCFLYIKGRSIKISLLLIKYIFGQKYNEYQKLAFLILFIYTVKATEENNIFNEP